VENYSEEQNQNLEKLMMVAASEFKEEVVNIATYCTKLEYWGIAVPS